MIKLSLLNKNYIKAYILMVCMLLLKNTNAQNLIQNGSFENYNNIDCVYGGFDNATVFPAVHVVDNWYSLNSSDYFNSVCTNTYAGVPINLFGSTLAKDGNAYVGFITYLNGTNSKEYVYQHLNSSLIAGKSYCLSFFVAKADRMPYAVASIGAYFSVSTPTLFSSQYVSSTPQIINQSGFLTDTTQWIKISGCFIANGNEQYITIGKFNSTGTDTLNVGTNNAIPNNPDESYYYIDSVTLIEDLSTGINEKDYGYNISVSPIPANNTLNIRLSTVLENTSISIVNSLGKIVLQQPLSKQKTELNIGHLQSGIYYYEISVNGKSIKNDKIVISK